MYYYYLDLSSGGLLDLGWWLAIDGDWNFAGSVHLVGGMAALCGAAIVGPRKGRFDENREQGLNLVYRGFGYICFVVWLVWF